MNKNIIDKMTTDYYIVIKLKDAVYERNYILIQIFVQSLKDIIKNKYVLINIRKKKVYSAWELNKLIQRNA